MTLIRKQSTHTLLPFDNSLTLLIWPTSLKTSSLLSAVNTSLHYTKTFLMTPNCALSVLVLMSIVSLVPWKPLHMWQSLRNFYHPFNLVSLFQVACNSLLIASNPLYTSTCLALPFIPLLPEHLFSLILSTCSMRLCICNVNMFLIMMICLGIWKQT